MIFRQYDIAREILFPGFFILFALTVTAIPTNNLMQMMLLSMVLVMTWLIIQAEK